MSHLTLHSPLPGVPSVSGREALRRHISEGRRQRQSRICQKPPAHLCPHPHGCLQTHCHTPPPYIVPGLLPCLALHSFGLRTYLSLRISDCTTPPTLGRQPYQGALGLGAPEPAHLLAVEPACPGSTHRPSSPHFSLLPELCANILTAHRWDCHPHVLKQDWVKEGCCSSDQDQKTATISEREENSVETDGKCLYQMASIKVPWKGHRCGEGS